MGFRKDWVEKSWDQFGQLPYPSRHQVSLPRQLLLDPWSLRIHPFSKLSKHSRKQKTRNCVETFLPRFPGDLLIDFSSFHMENRYFGISNFPLGPQDGYSAPPGPKIFKPFLQPQRSTLVLLSSLQSIQCNVHTLCKSMRFWRPSGIYSLGNLTASPHITGNAIILPITELVLSFQGSLNVP